MIKIKCFVVFILYIIGMIISMFKNISIFFDFNEYKKSKIDLKGIYIYKTLMILLSIQYTKKYKNKEKKEIVEDIFSDLFHIYKKYFEKSENNLN